METDNSLSQLPTLLQPSRRQVWVQAIARSLYQMGYGVIQFYIPLIFVNQVEMSATVVGIGIGSGSLAGVLGHLLGGYLADSPRYGRKRTLLFSAGLSILAALFLVRTQSLPMLVLANLLLGLSAGCYWTAADAAVMDVTSAEQRHRAFAILVLADNVGWGLGILGGGALLTLFPQTQILFLATSLVFLLFWVLIQTAVSETDQDSTQTHLLKGFVTALQDRSLLLFVLANLLFTTYIAVVNTTLPLYLTKVMASSASSGAGTMLVGVANLFTWCYIGFGTVLQFPIVQVLNAVPKIRVLMLSMLLWGVGFLTVWVVGAIASFQLVSIVLALGVLSIATAAYKPFAPAIVAELAPDSLRGIYIALSYQCWSIGYFVGPVVGGWAMDQSPAIAHHAWGLAALSVFGGLAVLSVLGRSRVVAQSAESPAASIEVPEGR